ncbi:MAG: hypothetical protein AAGA85_00525 [Bacteroidota bacterium]
MRTSLIETRRIEELLTGQGDAKEQLLFQAESLINPDLAHKIVHQEHAVDTIRRYGRELLRSEIAEAQHELFSQKKHRSFQQLIGKIFKK